MISQTLNRSRSFAPHICRDTQRRKQLSVCRYCLPHRTVKLAEEGEMAASAAVQQVSAAGYHELTTVLSPVALTVPNPAVIVFPSHTGYRIQIGEKMLEF